MVQHDRWRGYPDASDTTSTSSLNISTLSIRGIIDRLKSQQHRDSTHAQYYAIWKIFNKFIIRLDVKPLEWEDRVNLFMGFMIANRKQSSTVRTYISAIKSVLLENDIELNEDRFLLNSPIRACKITDDSIQTRIPIEKDLLHLLIASVKRTFGDQSYLSKLYSAMLLTAYFGLFRIGEITASPYTITARDVHIGINKNKLLFVLRSSKTHGKGTKPQLIKISSVIPTHQPESYGDLRICPFIHLKRYIAARGSRTSSASHEQFFIFRDNTLVHAHHLRKVLKNAITANGLDAKFYDCHCLRLGRAVDLLKLGISVETIKKLGRWRLNAVYTYLASY